MGRLRRGSGFALARAHQAAVATGRTAAAPPIPRIRMWGSPIRPCLFRQARTVGPRAFFRYAHQRGGLAISLSPLPRRMPSPALLLRTPGESLPLRRSRSRPCHTHGAVKVGKRDLADRPSVGILEAVRGLLPSSPAVHRLFLAGWGCASITV